MTVSSSIRRGFHAAFFIGLYVAYLCALFFIAYVVDIDNLRHTGVRLLVPAIELAFFYVSCSLFLRHWLLTRRLIWIALYLILAATICFVYVVQIYSIYISDNFISVLGMQNIRYALFTESTTEWVLLACGGVWVCLLGLNAWWPARASRRHSQEVSGRHGAKRTMTVFIVLTLLTLAIFTQQRRRITLEPDYRQAPFASLMVNAWLTLHAGGSSVAENVPSNFSGKACFNQPADGKVHNYPFEKDLVYRDSLPFAPASPSVTHPNVIVFFTEGTSARLIESYGGKYSGLTPNIDQLARRSMRVVDYYNHTAATYRGIIGQTSSGFSFAGGGGESGWVTNGKNEGQQASISRRTLASILAGHGYASYFFEPEHDGSAFTHMLQYLGFENVYTFEKISALLDGHVSIQNKTNQLDDGTLFRGLTAFLKGHAAGNGKPFFIATYNIGTHAFIPMTSGGRAYGDGKSVVLNKLHNYDAAIGSFLDYFYTSSYAKNTILIFTSDHATYPEKSYREVAGKSLKPFLLTKFHCLCTTRRIISHGFLTRRGETLSIWRRRCFSLWGSRTPQTVFLGTRFLSPAASLRV